MRQNLLKCSEGSIVVGRKQFFFSFWEVSLPQHDYDHHVL